MKNEIKPGLSPHNGDLTPLAEKAGPLQKLGTRIATSRAAGKALRTIEAAKVEAQTGIALTAIALASTRIRSALVASAMPQIGALAVSLNSATTAVDQALTNGAAADVASHIGNRSVNASVVNAMERSGEIISEEKTVLMNFVEGDAASDIERSRHRMGVSKEAVSTLHGYALDGLSNAKLRLDS